MWTWSSWLLHADLMHMLHKFDGSDCATLAWYEQWASFSVSAACRINLMPDLMLLLLCRCESTGLSTEISNRTHRATATSSLGTLEVISMTKHCLTLSSTVVIAPVQGSCWLQPQAGLKSVPCSIFYQPHSVVWMLEWHLTITQGIPQFWFLAICMLHCNLHGPTACIRKQAWFACL